MGKSRKAAAPFQIRLTGAILAGAAAALSVLAANAQTPPPPPYLANFPNFATTLTAAFPGDVDTALKQSLENPPPGQQPQFAAVQRLFDLDAWQMFLAVNWPTDDNGNAAASITDYSSALLPHWTLWQTSSQIFRVDGKRPIKCGPLPVAGNLLESVAQRPAPLLRGLPLIEKPKNVNPRSVLVLGNLSAVGNISVIDLNKGGETDQAFSGPLIDQNGNFVHYDIALDPHEVQYICQNGIYNINGQIAFSQAGHKTLAFPIGTDNVDWSGATELKFAWKIIDPKNDQPSRFFTMPATIPDANGGTRQVTVGLVGMHIGHKTQSSPQWIWATFEQIDNLVGNTMAHPPIKASFYNPDCQICVPNLDPQKTGDYATPTQAVRAIQIPGEKVELNAQAQAALKSIGSVWQYYQLIDAQWPTEPKAAPAPWNGGLPDAVDNKPGGAPTPVFLTNITMETYFQKGVQDPCHQEEIPDQQPPIACPQPTNFPKVSAQIFASESCMGCHSSAGFFKSFDETTQRVANWPQLSGDFSWLPFQKACYIPKPGEIVPASLQKCTNN